MNLHIASVVTLVLTFAGAQVGFAQTNAPADPSPVRIVEIQGSVKVLRSGATTWSAASLEQPLNSHDRVQTAENSRVALRWSDQSVIPFGAYTELEVLPPDSPDSQNGLNLVRGILSFFHRDKPGRIRVVTRGAVAGVEGTEFVVAVDNSDRTTLSVVDGRVSFGNPQASLVLTNGEQAVAEPGQAPRRTAGFIANNLLQWCFYYPAVIDPAELPLSDAEKSALANSLAAYRSGDLPGALASYPANRVNLSDAEHVYKAAVLLSVGEVDKAEAELTAVSANSVRPHQLALALRQVIAAVKRQDVHAIANPETASECLAISYLEQSRADRTTSLRNALALAKRATEIAPEFGFAWERVAELEFSFRNMNRALPALDQSLELSPKNAQALALKGFILSAQFKHSEAREWFDRAIITDSALGNAWLGRGLARIRLGDVTGGREDLLIAAALEPQRAELRSYLGKAYSYTGDQMLAEKELNLAKRLDPNDPTAWLYSALLNQQDNKINDAVRDLEKSKELNDNRSVYRSGLLLDQDRAVRSANLASIYRDAGMTDVSLWEAGRAVNADYANYSAHLFLASSYAEQLLRNQSRSRYESGAANEYLLANILSPASAGVRSPGMLRQQQFVPFERNHLGFISSSEYLSRGAWKESAIQYGTFDRFSYDLEADYLSDPGKYDNNDQETKYFALKFKIQATPSDSFFAEIFDYRNEQGDLQQYYDPELSAGQGRAKEKQEPSVTLGYHHEWSPGVHTLLMASRVDDDFSFAGRVRGIYAGWFPGTPFSPFVVDGSDSLVSVLQDDLALYSTEIQQIWSGDSHTTTAGARYQYGELHTSNLETGSLVFTSVLAEPPADQDIDALVKRFSVYGYHQWQIFEPLQLIGGLSYEWLEEPENLLSPPVSGKERSEWQLSPKAGLIWTPTKDTTLRFAYTQSLGSQNLDQSVRIEPSQVAGFLQTYRTLIGEPSVAITGPARNETFALSLEKRFSSGTYLGVNGEILESKIRQIVGSFNGRWDLDAEYALPGGLRNHVDYREESIQFTANQLVGRDWAFGAVYRLSHAELNEDFVDISDHAILTSFEPRRNLEGTLHHANVYAIYNHPCGFFSRLDGQWYSQANSGYAPAEHGDEIWQFDGLAGYRFLQRRAEITAGVLNLTDQNYRLNPLNAHAELPRDRTFIARLVLSF